MEQVLFGAPTQEPESKPSGDVRTKMRLLVTVKAAPNPSAAHGETVCVAALRLDPDHEGWIRLYPINFRELENDARFAKYDVVTLEAMPARGDGRRESWKPRMDSLAVEKHLRSWEARRPWLEPYVARSMCELNRGARAAPDAKSLALVRPRAVLGLDIRPHPGWTEDEQGKIDGYVNQLDLFGTESRRPLEAPRFKGYYRYYCHDPACPGHRQGLIDWEWVAFQRRLAALNDEDAEQSLRRRFLDEVCAADRDVAFYVGNQAKHRNVFSVLGVYWPKR